jgi:hypothetical protein
MADENAPAVLPFLAMAVAALAARLEPGEAAPVAAAAARRLLAATATLPHTSLLSFATGVAALARHLRPEEVAQVRGPVVQLLSDSLARTNGPVNLNSLAVALGSLTACLGPEAAAQLSRAAVRKFPDALPAETTGFSVQTLIALPRVVQALAPGLTVAEATELTDTLAERLVEALATGTDPAAQAALAHAVEALAPNLGPVAAAAAFLKVFTSLCRTTDPAARYALVRALEALGARLPPAEAAGAAQRVLDTLDWKAPASVWAYAPWAVGMLAPRLEPADAGATARHLLAAEKRFLPLTRPETAGALLALAARLPPAERARVLEAAARLLATTPYRLNIPLGWASLASTVGALEGSRGPDEVNRTVEAIAHGALDVLATVKNPAELPFPARALAAAAPGLGPGTAAAGLHKLVDALAKTADPKAGVYRPEALPALRALGARVPAGDLVELLKAPTCVGEARAVLVQELGRRGGPPSPEAAFAVSTVAAGEPRALAAVAQLTLGEQLYPGGRRPFTGLWEAVEYLRAHHPELDLAAPLRRLPH